MVGKPVIMRSIPRCPPYDMHHMGEGGELPSHTSPPGLGSRPHPSKRPLVGRQRGPRRGERAPTGCPLRCADCVRQWHAPTMDGGW